MDNNNLLEQFVFSAIAVKPPSEECKKFEHERQVYSIEDFNEDNLSKLEGLESKKMDDFLMHYASCRFCTNDVIRIQNKSRLEKLEKALESKPEKAVLVDAIFENYRPQPTQKCFDLEFYRFQHAEKSAKKELGIREDGPPIIDLAPDEEKEIMEHIEECAYCLDEFEQEKFIFKNDDQLLSSSKHQNENHRPIEPEKNLDCFLFESKLHDIALETVVAEMEAEKLIAKRTKKKITPNVIQFPSSAVRQEQAPLESLYYFGYARAAMGKEKTSLKKNETIKAKRIIFKDNKVAGEVVFNFDREKGEIRVDLSMKYPYQRVLKNETLILKNQGGDIIYDKIKLTGSKSRFILKVSSGETWKSLLEGGVTMHC